MCPFAVSSDSGKCFEMFSTVRPGKVTRLPLWAAVSNVAFVGNLADVNTALATLRYTVPATAVSTTISITASYAGIYGNYRYNPATGSFYLRDAATATRTTVLNRTTASSNCGITFNGMCGYMAIPNNADESLFIFQKLGQGWIGLSKPSHPTLQYVANAPSGLPITPFTFWSAGEGGVSTEPNIAATNCSTTPNSFCWQARKSRD